MIGPAVGRGKAGAVGAALEVESLSVVTDRSSTPIVADVSFHVGAGQVMGLVGESGSGKSTVGLALLGHARRGLRISAGMIRVGETDVLRLRGVALRRARGRLVSYVPQDPGTGLNPALRIGAQLREAIRAHDGVLDAGERREDRMAQLLRDVSLPGTKSFLRSFPHQVSGGQQQRIAIAMAFACRPRLIVLDEPTTGLDVTTQRRVLDTVRNLTRTYGVTALYISHDLPVIAEIADETAVMYAGRIVERGPSASLFDSPLHPYTSMLLRAAPTPDRASVLVGIEGHPPPPGQWPVGCTFAERCPRATDICLRSEPRLDPVAAHRLVRCYHPITSRPALSTGDAFAPPHGRAGMSVRGLTALYGETRILHDVNLSIEPGACVAVVGESGSGKTTLARCLVGLHPRWRAEAYFDGVALASAARQRTADQRRRIQYVFQNPYASLNPRMSVAENVEEPLRHFERFGWRERRSLVLEALELVALSGAFADRMPAQLSGGERQRVAIARALVVRPDLLICDEVTSALDVSVQALVVEQLRQLQHEHGLTLLFITHNLAVVRSIAQQVTVLELGRVVEHADVAQVLARPAHPYTRQLLEDLPRFPVAPRATQLAAQRAR